MIAAVALLLVCQLAGEVLVRLLSLPLPGPVVGLVLLAVGLGLRRRIPDQVHDAAHGILRNLSLMFVPAAVGIVGQGEVLAAHGWALAAALVVSTLAAMAVAALVFKWASARFSTGAETGKDPTA